MRRRRFLIMGLVTLLTVGCRSTPEPRRDTSAGQFVDLPASDRGREVVIFSLSLLDTGYRFGGKNPDAGLDCSGMVAWVYRHAVGYTVTGSAAMIAQQGRPCDPYQLSPGDLVFFNTQNRPFSHVGIYLGEGKFIHAPNRRGRVRVDSMLQPYYRKRYHAARRYF